MKHINEHPRQTWPAYTFLAEGTDWIAIKYDITRLHW